MKPRMTLTTTLMLGLLALGAATARADANWEITNLALMSTNAMTQATITEQMRRARAEPPTPADAARRERVESRVREARGVVVPLTLLSYVLLIVLLTLRFTLWRKPSQSTYSNQITAEMRRLRTENSPMAEQLRSKDLTPEPPDVTTRLEQLEAENTRLENLVASFQFSTQRLRAQVIEFEKATHKRTAADSPPAHSLTPRTRPRRRRGVTTCQCVHPSRTMVRSIECPYCGSAPGILCTEEGNPRHPNHKERVDAFMALNRGGT